MKLLGVTVQIIRPNHTLAVCVPPAQLDCRGAKEAVCWLDLAGLIERRAVELAARPVSRDRIDNDWVPPFLRYESHPGCEGVEQFDVYTNCAVAG